MDYYFSGINNRVSQNLIERRIIQKVMPSFMYPEGLIAGHGLQHCIVDSGAHSIQERGVVGSALDEYVAKWAACIQQYPGTDAIFVELDIDEAGIPLATIDSIYRDLVSLGRPIMRVWHSFRGIETFYRYVEEEQYLGVSALDGFSLDFLFRLVSYAFHRGVKIHGFGCGSPVMLKKVPFYSCDSSGHMKQIAYGRVKSFEFGGFKPVLLHNARNTTLGRYGQHSGRTKQDLYDYQVGQYLKMEAFFTEYWNQRGFVWK